MLTFFFFFKKKSARLKGIIKESEGHSMMQVFFRVMGLGYRHGRGRGRGHGDNSALSRRHATEH